MRLASLPRVQPSSMGSYMESYSGQGLQLYQDLYQEDLPAVDWIAGLHSPSTTAIGRARNLVKNVPQNGGNTNVGREARRDSLSQSWSHSLRGGSRRGLQSGPGALEPSSGGSSLEQSLEEGPGGGGGGGGGGVLSNLGACDPYHEGDDWCSAEISAAESRALEIQDTEMYCSRECANRGGRRWCNASCIAG